MTTVPGFWSSCHIARCAERIASTHPTPVNTSPTRLTTAMVPRAPLMSSTRRNGRLRSRYPVAVKAAARLPANTYPRMENATRLIANAAKKP